MASQAQLRAAQEAIRQGRRREARALLIQAAKEEPGDFRVWLLLAGVAGSPRASLEYLERAERLQPGHPTIARARAWAEAKQAAEEAQAPAPVRPRLERPAPAAEPAAPPPAAPATTDERIARTRAARAAKRLAQRRRTVLRAAVLALLLVLLAVAGSWVWSQRAPGAGGEAQAAPAGSAPVSVASAPAASEQEAPEAAGDEVVRVQFAPRRAAAATGAPVATPTPLAREVHSKVSGSAQGGTARPTWTVTPSPTPTSTPTPTMAPTFVSESSVVQPVLRPAGVGPGEKWVDVNLTQQRLVAYEGDVPVFDTLVSSGLWNHPTVTGQFRVYLRFTSQTMDGRRLGYDYFLEDVPYVMYFFEDYALHGTYWHNNFGTPMSHGCVNLPTPAAEWIFNWSSIGLLVSVHY